MKIVYVCKDSITGIFRQYMRRGRGEMKEENLV